jgi:hypothetical protein
MFRAFEDERSSDSNNVVIWLRPSPVVAKVVTGHHRRLAVELPVAQQLVACGAPAVRPSDLLPQEVHRAEGFDSARPRVAASERRIRKALRPKPGPGGRPVSR